MNEKTSLVKDVDNRFRDYLLANELRQTRERYAILDAIYQNFEGTFNIEDLQDFMTLKKFPVSKSAIYTTIELLVKANLVIRHPFSSSSSIYERAIDNGRPHSYQICSQCHRITRIKSKELATAVETYHPRQFNVTHRIVYVYGCCPKCASAMRKKLKQINKLNE